MKRPRAFPSPWSKPALAATVCLAVALLIVPVRAQVALPPSSTPGPGVRLIAPPPPLRPFGEDTHVFRRLLFDLKHKPVARGELLPGLNPPVIPDNPPDPKTVIVVVLGDPARVGGLPGGGVKGFLEKGGAVLLASDKPLPPTVNADLNQLVGCTVNGQHFIYRGDNEADNCYHGENFCPFLVPSAGGHAFFRNPKDFDKPTLRVATNVPSVLSAGQGEPRPPAGAEEIAQLKNLRSELAAGLQPPPSHSFMFARKTDNGGRLLVLADHSIFINYMMMPEDNGNVEFTANCLEWLNAGSATPKRVLFLDDGHVNDKFEVPITEVTPPQLGDAIEKAAGELERKLHEAMDNLQEKANPKLADAEDHDLFNNWLNEKLTDGHRPWWHYFGIGFVLLTLVGLVVGFFRLVLHGFQQQNPVAPSLARLVDQQEPNQSLMEQRNQGMFQAGNLWEIGRQLARQTFETAGIPAKVGDPLPAVRANGGWWQRRRVRDEVAHLWALAFGARPVPVAPTEWPLLLRRLDWLRKSLAAGSVRLG